MHGEELAAEGARDPLLAVEHDVEREVRAGGRGDRAHVVVHGVALRDAPARVGVADARGVVQRQRRLEAREARGDELRTAGEAGEEVRLDEAGGDADIGGDPLAVEPHRHVGAVAAHPGQRALVAGIVVDDAHGGEHLVAEHRAQLVGRVAAMGAGGDEHDDVLEPHEALELLEQGGHDDLARLRARAVADADRDRPPAAHDLAQRRAGDGTAQRLEHRGARVGGGLRMQRLDDRRAVVRAGRP